MEAIAAPPSHRRKLRHTCARRDFFFLLLPSRSLRKTKDYKQELVRPLFAEREPRRRPFPFSPRQRKYQSRRSPKRTPATKFVGMVSVSVCCLFFASVRDRLDGKTQDNVRLPKNRWQDSRQLLDFLCCQLYPSLTDLKSSLALAINEEYALEGAGEIVLQENDTLAFIPPITGG